MPTVQKTSIPSSDYRDLLLTQLVESPTNPRKRYDEARLRELADTIREQAVLEPLLVRPLDNEKFEIVAGSRRFRAAQLAGVGRVPVRVLHLDDAASMLAQVVENGQREDIHPLEEANGFRALLDLPGQPFTIAMIAAKAGKTPQYVAQRLKLTELVPPAADAFLADRLTVGHALLIAKLPPAQQGDALTAAFKTTWMTGGETQILIPVKELAGWIESNLLLELQIAPFDRSDAALLPQAGACHDCPKRTGANALLFPETDRDQCLDRPCYQAKVAAHVARAVERDPHLIQISGSWGTPQNGALRRGQYVQIEATKLSRKGRDAKPEQKKCAHMTKGIVVEGGGCGHIVDVCAEPACEIHHDGPRQSREAQEKARAAHRREEERRKEELVTRRRVLAAILAKVTAPLAKADLELIGREFINHLPQQYRTLLRERHAPVPAGKSKSNPPEIEAFSGDLDEAGYSRLLIEISLLDAAYNAYSQDGAKRLEAVARRYRVNVERIAVAVAAEFSSNRKKREERRQKANGKSKSSGRLAKSSRA